MKKILFLGPYAKEFSRMLPTSLQNKIIVDYEQKKDLEYDILCVCEGINYPIKVKTRKTIFTAGEPIVIRNYKHKFLTQFDIAYNTIDYTVVGGGRQVLPWHIGLKKNPQQYNFDYFFYNQFLNKTKQICVIASNKTYTKGHVERLNFSKLCAHKIANCDLFGRGINDFEDKIDFLPKYKYQIVIENCSIPDYWSEKLADSFLAGCYTFYYGCTNIRKYFPENSYSLIDINKPEESIEIINQAINNMFYEKNIKEIQNSKMRVLTEFNIFQLLDNIELDKALKMQKIYPENNFSDISLRKRLLIKLKKLFGVSKNE